MKGAERTLSELLDLTGKLDAERSLTSALQYLTDVALELLPGDHTSLRLMDRSQRELLPAARSFSGSDSETSSPPHPLRVELAAQSDADTRRAGSPEMLLVKKAALPKTSPPNAEDVADGSTFSAADHEIPRSPPTDSAAHASAQAGAAGTGAAGTGAAGTGAAGAGAGAANAGAANAGAANAGGTSPEVGSEASAWGVPAVVEQAGEGFAQGVAGWVVARGEAARIADAYLDQRFVVQPNQGFVIRSMLAVPLWSAGEVVGVLAATSKQPAIYQQQHEKLACLLASCAVPRIEKARRAKLAETAAQVLDHTILAAELHSQMNQAYATGSSLSLLLVGLDNFKQINEKYSRRAGDKILAAVGAIVRESTRMRDVVVRRRSDEFAVVMPAASKENGTAAAERLRALIEFNAITLPSGAEVQLTTSIGVATWDGDEPPQQLETRTEEALLAAKRHGRNRIHFDYSYDPRRDRRGTSDDGYPIFDELTASDDAFEITDEATVTDDGD